MKSLQHSLAVNNKRWCPKDATKCAEFDEMKFHRVPREVEAKKEWQIRDNVDNEKTSQVSPCYLLSIQNYLRGREKDKSLRKCRKCRMLIVIAFSFAVNFASLENLLGKN